MNLFFLLDHVPNSEIKEVKAALYEIALRIGLPFSFHKSVDDIPTDGFIVTYGTPTPSKFNGLELSKVTKGTFDSFNVNEKRLWARSADDNIDVIAGSINLLTFQHEKLNNPERDSKGRILPINHILYEKELLQTPLLENNAAYIEELIKLKLGRDTKRSYPWEPGTYVLAMTHDVDGPESHSRFARIRSAFLGFLKKNKFERDSFFHAGWTKKYNKVDPYWNFKVWMDLERQWGIKSAFYFYTGETKNGKRHKNDPHYDFLSAEYVGVANEINQAGWEVGLHYGINVDTSIAYSEAIERIRSKIGQEKIGGRAHYWSIDRGHSPLETFNEMNDGNVHYDTSISPQRLGFRNGSMLPVSPSLFSKGVTAPLFSVLPTAIMDAYCMKRYGLSESPKDDALKLFRQIKKSNGMIILDWHVRTAHNLGAWQGFLDPLHELMTEFNNDDSGKAMLPSEIAESWKRYAENLFRGDHC